MTTYELKNKLLVSEEFYDLEREEAIALIDNLKESNEKLFKMVLDLQEKLLRNEFKEIE